AGGSAAYASSIAFPTSASHFAEPGDRPSFNDMHGAPPEQIGATYCTPAEGSGEEEKVCAEEAVCAPRVPVHPPKSAIAMRRMAHRCFRFALLCITTFLRMWF